MKQVSLTQHVAMPPDDLWNHIGRFGAIRDWHPMLECVATVGEFPGSRRVAYTMNGDVQVERLQQIDPQQRSYRYSVEQTSMPVDHYVGELQVSPAGNGTSVINWSAEFNVEFGDTETAENIRQFLAAGLRNIRSTYGDAAATDRKAIGKRWKDLLS